MWVPDLGVNTCAVVEFETQEQAQTACREINMINREKGELRVALLKPGARIRRTLYRQYKEGSQPQEVSLKILIISLRNTTKQLTSIES